jgi:hypothetical protein
VLQLQSIFPIAIIFFNYNYNSIEQLCFPLSQKVGAWGCFDEFNRLEERMLSAVSQQIQTIQESLKEHQTLVSQALLEKKAAPASIQIEIVKKMVTVNPNMAIFITMNPGYAGRSNLPDNLKKLFRSLAMTQPDNVLIAQVSFLFGIHWKGICLLYGIFFKLQERFLLGSKSDYRV